MSYRSLQISLKTWRKYYHGKSRERSSRRLNYIINIYFAEARSKRINYNMTKLGGKY